MMDPNAQAIDITVQIVNYRSKAHLEVCLPTLLQQLNRSGLNYIIKIVDNGSGDDLNSLVKRFKSNQILFYTLSKNCGFGAGHNFLFKQAPNVSKHLLILNPDTILNDASRIDKLVFQLDSNKHIGIVGPALRQGNNRQPWDHGEKDGWKARVANLAGGSYYQQRDEPLEVAWVSGAAFVIRIEIFRKLNGFDEHFFLFKEEEDLCLRARQAGYRILYDPTVEIIHTGSGSGASKNHYMAESITYFNQKHLGKHNYVAKIAGWLYERYKLWE